MKTISLCIPVYNEERYIYALLEKVCAVEFSLVWYQYEILVVNDGSTDRSDEEIKKFINNHASVNITYVRQPNQGKWSAIKHAFSLAIGDVLVIQDADLEYDPQDIIEGIRILEEKQLDVCYGSRIRGFTRYGIAISTVWFLIGWLTVSWVASLLSRHLITDEPTCYKMFRVSCKPYLLLPEENGFAWEPAATMAVLRAWFHYGERPIRYYPRKTTAGKKIKLIDGWKALTTLWRRRWKKIVI